MSQPTEFTDTITRIRAIASRPRYAGQKKDVIRECEDALAHFHGLRHLEPVYAYKPKRQWLRFFGVYE